MVSASAIRLQIESSLAQRIPSALTPAPKMIRPVVPTGIEMLDALLKGGLPVGAINEIIGSECSGRTTMALSFLACITQAGKVGAWVDVSNSLDPASAAAAGVDLTRMLWVRCGALPTKPQSNALFKLPDQYLVPPPIKKALHGGGFGSHPRGETKGLSKAVSSLLQSEQQVASHRAEPQLRHRQRQETFERSYQSASTRALGSSLLPRKPWPRIEQALKTTDLLLQGGGFSAIVVDMGSLAPEFVSRVPLATWFRYRAAAERTQSSILLLTQYACAKSSAELSLRLPPGEALDGEATVFTGIKHRVEVTRRRFTQAPSNLIPLLRKPPQSEMAISWLSRTTWVGRR